MMTRHRMHRDQINLMVGVENATSGARLGHVVDISISGLGISGHRETLEPMTDGELDLLLPWPMHEQSRIRLRVHRSWLKEVGQGRWHAGFEIQHCSDAGQLALEHLVSRFTE